MAMTMTRPPSTSDSGPSSNPISRAASTSSSSVPHDQSASDGEEEWLGPFREELRRNHKERLTELMQQAEAEYRRQLDQLVVRRARPNAPDGLSDAAYESTLARLDRSFEAQKKRIQRLLEEEESVLIERERGLRKLSIGAKLDNEQTEALIREQEELLKMYQAQAHRSESVNANSSETAAIPSTSSQQRTWVPPARPISSQKSNASTATSVSRTKRGSTLPQTISNLTEDLFPKQAQHESGSACRTSWEVDGSFRSSSEIHEEPEEMSDSEIYSDEERSTDDGGEEEEVSQKDDSNPGDAYYILPGFIRAPESSFSAVPTKSAPLAIARGGAHQSSSRGRSRVSGRTPPSAATIPYVANTTPVRHQSQNQCLSRNNSDTQHKLWKPSREETHPPLNRRPSILDPGNREQERIREPGRSWTEYENTRTRSSTGPASGPPSTSVSPSTQGGISSSFGASSAATFAQSQRPTDTSARIWRPPENKTSMPATSNIHVMASGNASLNSTAATISSSSSALPTSNVYSSRRRNDSDTSAGSPAKRPSQQQTQIFVQPMPSPKASLPMSTPGISASRRSPVHASDSFETSSSSPIATPSLSASIARHSPFGRRPSSPSVLSASVSALGTSLSRQPTEIVDPTSIRQESRANKSSRASLKSRIVEELPESGSPSTSPSSSSFGEHMRSSPSISALSEHMVKARERDADKDLEKREELITRQSEELRLRDAQYYKCDAELSTRVQTYDIEAAEQQRRNFEEQQRKLREELLEAQRVAQEKLVRELRKELAATQRAREAEFADQKRVLEALRQREAELRMQKERELAEKEEELDQHKREMEERLRLRGEREIAEQTRQLEQLKKKEAALEEQQQLLEEQRQLELAEQRKREEELRQKVEELKRQQRELMEAQRKKEEREQEEVLRRQEEEALLEEQRRKEDELRAQEDELKQKKLELLQREEALARRRKEEELRAKEEALERQRRELQQREEELARREEEEERRKKEEQARKEAALRRQQEEGDKKRLEVHMQRKLAQEREQEEEERKQRERQVREREEERERRMQREREEQRRLQEEYEQRTRNTERRRQEEEEGHVEGLDIREQAELLHFFEQRKAQEEARKRDLRGASSSTSFSSSIPNLSSSFSSAQGTFPSGRATSSASSIHSNWSGSQRSSASSASSAASDFSRTSTGSSATSWSSSTRPTTASTGSAGSNRTATTGESHKPTRGAWKSSNSGGMAAGPAPSGAGAGSYTNTSPLSEAEWRRRQEEHARRQQEQFRRDSLRSEQERLAQSAAAALSSPSGREQIQQAWARYESAWASLKERPILYFRSMPWPVLRQPSTPEDLTTNVIGTFVLSPAHSTDKSPRDRLKEQLLRWHPDRFESKWISKVDAKDKENVLLGAGQVARGLNELLSREALDPFG